MVVNRSEGPKFNQVSESHKSDSKEKKTAGSGSKTDPAVKNVAKEKGLTSGESKQSDGLIKGLSKSVSRLENDENVRIFDENAPITVLSTSIQPKKTGGVAKEKSTRNTEELKNSIQEDMKNTLTNPHNEKVYAKTFLREYRNAKNTSISIAIDNHSRHLTFKEVGKEDKKNIKQLNENLKILDDFLEQEKVGDLRLLIQTLPLRTRCEDNLLALKQKARSEFPKQNLVFSEFRRFTVDINKKADVTIIKVKLHDEIKFKANRIDKIKESFHEFTVTVKSEDIQGDSITDFTVSS